MTQRVLIVDDSMLMRRLVNETLACDGWEVVAEAADGDRAVELYQRHRPDAVTLDIIMPGPPGAGMKALQEILRIDADAKVVVVSALNQNQAHLGSDPGGAQDFIAKPFMPEQLQATLRACIAESVRV